MRRWLWSVLVTIALLAAACGGATTPAASPAPAEAAPAEAAPAEVGASGTGFLPEVNPLEVSGDIIVAGSSTVYPLTERLAERFRDE